jgi:drug/metabolite transporter (DMT)-like permease
MSRHPSPARALPVVVAFATLLFLVLGIGAIGIIGNGDADRIYLAAIAVFVVGALVARFRPQPMAVAMLATAATMVGCTVVAFAMGEHRNPGASASDMVMLTTMYAGLFAFAAWLFARSAHRRPRRLSPQSR